MRVRIGLAVEFQGRRIVGILRMMFLVLLQGVEFTFEMTDFGLITSGFRRFDLGLVLADVLVDGFHGICPKPAPHYDPSPG